MKMKKLFCTTLFLCTASVQASEVSFFNYGNLHAMGGYPMVGMGVRTQKGVYAIDIAVNACPLFPPDSLNIYHVRNVHLIYPKKRGFYFGAGLGIMNDPESMKHPKGSLEVSLGWDKGIGPARFFVEADGMFYKTKVRRAQFCPGLTTGFGF